MVNVCEMLVEKSVSNHGLNVSEAAAENTVAESATMCMYKVQREGCLGLRPYCASSLILEHLPGGG